MGRDAGTAVAGLARPTRPIGALVLAVAAIALLSLNLRMPTSATGPLLPTIGADTGHGETVLSLLTTIPLVLVFAIAPLTPRIAGRFGRDRVVGWVLGLVVAGTVLRSLPGGAWLFVGTTVLGVGIALGTVLGPASVAAARSQWRGGLTATYTMSLSLGPALALALTIPLMDASGLDWRGTLLLWGAVGVLGLTCWIAYARSRRTPGLDEVVAAGSSGADGESGSRGLDAGRAVGNGPGSALEAGEASDAGPTSASESAGDSVLASAPAATPALRAARDPRVWGLAVYLGTTSLVFYVTSTWLPTTFAGLGLSADSAGGFTSLISFVAIPCAFAAPLALRRGWGSIIVPAGPLIASTGVVLLLAAEAGGVLAASLLLGVAQGICLGVSYGLVVEFATSPEHAASVSAVTSTVGIALAALGPLAFGFGLEASGSYVVPTVGLAVIALAQAVLGLWTGRLAPARRG